MDWPGDIFSIVLAIVLGAAIGVEREFSGKPAGLRTNILICLGAAIFTIISKQMAGENEALTRIAAQIVTGVGFLGAGAIIQDRGGVHGLTTAATIWFMACLGMACGAGLYKLAVISTLLAIFILIGLRLINRSLSRYMEKNKPRDVSDEPD
ncbi:MAG: MgtC/SapB family protein [Phycisphaerae bacterium]|nr:MgtC/SapB family protein [Phycisphaerae bacterium]NIP54300.1 MgtC/SapB family protein [Phycisphaerae bacterium]NIS53169.1 MgtC/SapB family protein [Phycisphaerae bacterium]NIU10654.1 MgtC/SapB family protein [Phycisphaerae bacterium]NIU58415.1 MgtC/SapB family protein [Phycisphaerae bacterium]